MRTSAGLSLRWRLILTFAASGALAVASTMFLLVAAATLASVLPPLGALLSFLSATVGAWPVMLLVCLVLFFGWYILLSQPLIRYIEAMSRAMDEVARGNFEVTLPPRGLDELGLLGQNLVAMSRQVKSSLERERQATQARYELITAVSHDLRTPLTSVLGYLQLIDEDKYRDEVELRYYVDMAYEKARQLKRLIDQLFEFTRTSHGALVLRPVPINPAELLEQVAEEFVPALRQADMEYRLRLPEARVTIHADPDLLVRVLENLISNAIRYGREGKLVELELDVDRAGRSVLIRVANRGNPIPVHQLEHIFESFYRGERSRSGKTGGAGLGLAIVKNIVTLHGGSVRAINETDRTVFEVRLPFGAAPARSDVHGA
ncbi:signal transduction histidine kinase [Symbiobacterium terraclitae]|uniref:histidine kinase n=1 Tax=Symbiobacterium terraclitae TaxID=557451 RepID=A0ABS4JST8_9FIRM|nr:HAMP domain-containing sensor histidine kinase [Symbiobacterium terraclitae]MBP2018598.1 signal transduction histidine kinase [Symbiobacterium terraclitae]